MALFYNRNMVRSLACTKLQYSGSYVVPYLYCKFNLSLISMLSELGDSGDRSEIIFLRIVNLTMLNQTLIQRADQFVNW